MFPRASCGAQRQVIQIEAMEQRLLMSAACDFTFAPGAMLADPGRNIAYFADNSAGRLLAISSESGRVVASAPSGATAMAISSADDEIFVAAAGSSTLSVYSLPALEPLRTIDVGVPVGKLALGPGNIVFVAGSTQATGATVYTIDASTGTTLSQFVVADRVAHLQYNVRGESLFVVEKLPDTTGRLEEFGLDGIRLHAVALPGLQADDSIAIDPVRRMAYVPFDGVHVISIDAGEKAVWGFPEAEEGFPGFAAQLSADGEGLAVVAGDYRQHSALLRYSIADGTLLWAERFMEADWPSGGLAVTPDGRELFALARTSALEPMQRELVLTGAPDLTLAGGPGTGPAPADPAAPCTVVGAVYDDRDGNHVRDAGDRGLQGWQVFADLNNDGQQQESEPSATSNGRGYYRFENVPAGRTRIIAVPPSVRRMAGPYSGAAVFSAALSPGHPRTLRPIPVAARQTAGRVFRRAGDGVAAISGWHVFADLNGDRVWNASEPAVRTDGQGRFCFDHLIAGKYEIEATPAAAAGRRAVAGQMARFSLRRI